MANVSEWDYSGGGDTARRILVAISEPELRDEIRTQLASDERYRVELAGGSPAAQLPAIARTADAVLLGLPDVLALGRRKAKLLDDLQRHSKVLLFLERPELVQALEVAPRCDGFVFVDLNMERLGEIIDLALWGYCMIPAPIVAELTSHQLRLDLVKELRDDEMEVLALLGNGLTNRTISSRVGLPESTIKNIVRSVLKKLHFRNRTEAAVFAFAHRRTISSAGVRS